MGTFNTLIYGTQDPRVLGRRHSVRLWLRNSVLGCLNGESTLGLCVLTLDPLCFNIATCVVVGTLMVSWWKSTATVSSQSGFLRYWSNVGV